MKYLSILILFIGLVACQSKRSSSSNSLPVINDKQSVDTRKIDSNDNEYEAFSAQKSTRKLTGKYRHEEGEIEVYLDLRDGLAKGSYSFYMTISSPKRCVSVFRNLEIFPNPVHLVLDTIGQFRIELDGKLPRLVTKSFDNTCEEILDIDFELEKEN